VAALRQRLVRMNPRARIAEACHGVAAVDDLLDIHGFDLNAILEIEHESGQSTVIGDVSRNRISVGVSSPY
jgi:G3E family GTPase